MTVGIECDCGEEVAFFFDGEVKRPKTTCGDCGETYELRIKKVN